MGKRAARQASPMWVDTADLPTSDGHPFFERLNRVLEDCGFDAFVEELCATFYADRLGRPSLRPGRYFRRHGTMCYTIFHRLVMIFALWNLAIGTAEAGPILESAKAKAAQQVTHYQGMRASAVTKVVGVAGVGYGAYVAYTSFRDIDPCIDLDQAGREPKRCKYNLAVLGAGLALFWGGLYMASKDQHSVVVNVRPSGVEAVKRFSF